MAPPNRTPNKHRERKWNFNDEFPPPPAGSTNIKVQIKGLDISAYVPLGAGGGIPGFSGAVQIGHRVDLPDPPDVDGNVYVCDDASYWYVSQDSEWRAFVGMRPVVEPTGLVLVNGDAAIVTLDTDHGGYRFSADGTADAAVAYVTPVACMHKALLGLYAYHKSGVALYNAGNNKLVFLRTLLSDGPSFEITVSNYDDDGATFVSETTVEVNEYWPWPTWTWMLTKEGDT